MLHLPRRCFPPGIDRSLGSGDPFGRSHRTARPRRHRCPAFAAPGAPLDRGPERTAPSRVRSGATTSRDPILSPHPWTHADADGTGHASRARDRASGSPGDRGVPGRRTGSAGNPPEAGRNGTPPTSASRRGASRRSSPATALARRAGCGHDRLGRSDASEWSIAGARGPGRGAHASSGAAPEPYGPSGHGVLPRAQDAVGTAGALRGPVNPASPPPYVGGGASQIPGKGKRSWGTRRRNVPGERPAGRGSVGPGRFPAVFSFPAPSRGRNDAARPPLPDVRPRVWR
jgi:hypothetical protein